LIKKVNKQWLYEDGKKYQKTGVFTKRARAEENVYIKSNISDWYFNWKRYLKKYKKDPLNFDTWISLEISKWELKYGFYISGNHPKMKKLLGRK